jgi:membrane-associated phospholipid phosphatase
MKKLIKKIFSLRLEEVIGLLFFIPMVSITLKAYMELAVQHAKIPPRISGGLHRIWITVFIFLIFILIIRIKKDWRFIRDWMPFAFCIAIYTNLHDTIGFVNPHDIHVWLIKADAWMFGVQPCVWIQKYISPGWTDFFIGAYANYFVLVICVPFVLYLQKRYEAFRYTLLTIIICYYAGYFLFILFPAAPPRLVLKEYFFVNLQGELLANINGSILKASSSRGAFPSLHCGVSIVTLLFAWKYIRWMFWMMLPAVVVLLISTVYLRHHYVIDLFAGLLLGVFIYRLGPRLEEFWQKFRIRHIQEEKK